MGRKKFIPKSMKQILFILIAACAFLVVSVMASSPPTISLISPQDNKIFNATEGNNVTFQCNATSNSSLRKIDLYTTINGSFSKTNTSCFGELCEDSTTMLLMHFNNDSSVGENNTYVYDWSGNGNNAIVAGATFNSTGGKFGGAFGFNGSGNRYMKISDSSSIRLAPTGSIEFWVKPSASFGGAGYLFLKGPADSTCTQSSYDVKISASTVFLDINGDNNILATSGDPHQSIGTITPGVWSYVVYTWNGSWVDIYLNGARDSPPQPQAYAISSNTYNLWIGATNDPTCAYYPYFNGTIDELAVYNRQLTLQEVSEHYNRTRLNNATKNWTIKNVSDGTYTWNCRAYDNESQSGWSANRTFYVDRATPPTVNWIILSPNSTDDADPGVMLTVTANVTDISNVSAAILQYKSPFAGTFSNVTMTFNSSSGIYNASFTPPVSENGLWKYKIWANDTLGNAGAGNESNISVEFDHTWTVSIINSSGNYSSDMGRTYAQKNKTASMGVITINNTGDYVLNFDLSSSPDIAAVAYNVTKPFDLAAKNVKSISVNATAPDTAYEYSVQIAINASAGGTPLQRIVNGTLISYVGGPNLVVTIENYTSTPAQSATFNLSAKVKNIGNETAVGTWLNWTLPAGWDVLEGNLSAYLGNLTSDSTGWNNVKVYINPGTASSGVSSISASAGAQNASGSDSKVVGISCSNADGVCGKGCSYASDTNCPQPAASATTGSSAASTTTTILGGGISYGQKYAMRLDAPERIDAYRGKKETFEVNVSNDAKNTVLEDITLLISGYPQVHIKVNPASIGALNYNEAKSFEISVDVPEYMAYGEYNLTLLAKGTGTGSGSNTSEVKAEGKTIFIIHSASENETRAILDAAIKSTIQMKESNIKTAKIDTLLEGAKSALESWDYDRAKELAESAIETGNAAFKSYSLLKKISGILDEAKKFGVSAPETLKMYSLADAAFQREDYSRAEERANNALLTASIETTGKVTMLRTLHTNGTEIAAGIILLAVLGFVLYRRALAKRIAVKLTHLEEEETSLKKLIADAKKDYFGEKIMTKSEYYKAMYDYEKRAVGIRREKKELIMKKISLENPKKARDGFEKEETKLHKMMEDEQKKYFEDGKTSKNSYNNAMHELKSELAEIKMNVESANAVLKKSSKVLILAILSTIIMASAVGAEQVPAANNSTAAIAIANAERDIGEMQKAGIGITLANDTLNEAKILLSQGNYIGAESLARYVGDIKEKALGLGSKIDYAESKIYDAESSGLDASDARKLFGAGIQAFEAEDYVSAEKLLDSAIQSAEDVQANAAMQRTLAASGSYGVAGYVKKQWPNILILAAVAVLSGIAIRRMKKQAKAKKKMMRLEQETAMAGRMMKEIQKKFYESGTMTKSEYDAGMRKYRKIILKAKRELAAIENKSAKDK